MILDFLSPFSFNVLLLYSMMFIANVLFIFSGFASGLLKVFEFNLLFPLFVIFKISLSLLFLLHMMCIPGNYMYEFICPVILLLITVLLLIASRPLNTNVLILLTDIFSNLIFYFLMFVQTFVIRFQIWLLLPDHLQERVFCFYFLLL